MKKVQRLFLLFCTVLLFSGLFTFSASAAAAAPAKVTGLTAKTYESTSTLKWKKSSRATGYVIYRSTGNGSFKRLASTKKTTYTAKNLKPGTTYRFYVRSYRKVSGKTVYGSNSKTLTVKPKFRTYPSNPTGLKVYQTGSGKVYLSWDKSKNAIGYVLYQYNSKTKKYDRVTSSKKTSMTVSGLKNGTTYKFKIRSYRSVNGAICYSKKYSSVVSGTPNKLSKEASSVRTMGYKATVKSTFTASPANAKSKKQSVKKGTKVTVLSRGTTCKVQLPNNQVVYAKSSNLNFTSAVYTTKNYTRAQKEAFVNDMGYTSSTKYLIWVSTYTQTYSLYTGSRGNWKLLRTAKVATGGKTNPTQTRICKITKKAERHPNWEYPNGMYQAPIVFFYYENAFHSRLKYSDGSIADKTIGKPVSGGCIRMYDEDINYLYNNVPIGTTVVIY